MLTDKERQEVSQYGISALNAVALMKRIIADFENPVNEVTWGEFSRDMHRALSAYDFDKDKLESICRAEFKRDFLDDEEGDEE